MGEVLSNCVSVSIISSGFACRSGLYCRTNTTDYGICGRKYGCSMFHGSAVQSKWGCFLRFKLPRRLRNSIIASSMVASIEPVAACGEVMESHLIERREECLDLDSVRSSLPPWGNVVVQGVASAGEAKSGTQPLDVSRKMAFGIEIRVHFLEETNEEILSMRLLKLSRLNKVRSALELYESMKISGLQPNVHACNSLMSCLVRYGMLEYAFRVFEFMRTNEITTGHSYSLILKAVAHARGFDLALDMFVAFGGYSREKEDFDAIVYNTMISVCGKVNDWMETEKLWRRMKEVGLIGTRVTYSLLVCIFISCSQNDLAVDAYNEMIQNGLKAGDDVMQALIVSCSREGKWDLALNLFENMLNDRLKPNLICCNALINSLGKAGEAELSFKVHGILKTLGHTPDAYTWKGLLTALYKANQHADALHLFEIIKTEHSSELNVHLYNTALMSCQKLGLWEKSLQLLWQMETSELSVSTSSYNLVIGACEIARKPKVAVEVYEHMVHQKCTPDTFTYLSLTRSCIWGSLWAEVEKILELAPDVSLFNAVIQGMCFRGKFESAKKFYTRMRESGFKPNGKTRALMLQHLNRKM